MNFFKCFSLSNVKVDNILHKNKKNFIKANTTCHLINYLNDCYFNFIIMLFAFLILILIIRINLIRTILWCGLIGFNYKSVYITQHVTVKTEYAYVTNLKCKI